MQTAILYSTLKPTDTCSNWSRVGVTNFRNEVVGHLYVRAEPSVFDLEEALSKATPQEGEVVLNTVAYQT